ncbi:hypothetical protein [Streptomyces sp. enrichment culture]|uniref:hypothetical protein n=1 Tax=Streptomyces sp. enrichment culture TaxID=1795815 RepID=UPI003F55DB1D
MTDLGVDYDYLYTIKKDLKTVRNEFTTCSAHQESMKDEYGSDLVSGAMEKFTDNWDDHRKELLENIEKVGSLTEQAIQNFEKLDKELAEVNKKKKK